MRSATAAAVGKSGRSCFRWSLASLGPPATLRVASGDAWERGRPARFCKRLKLRENGGRDARAPRRLDRAVEDFADPARKVFGRQSAVPSAERFGFAEGLYRLVFVALLRVEGILGVLAGAEEGPDVAVVREVLSERAKPLRGVVEFAAEIAFQRVMQPASGVGQHERAGLRRTRQNRNGCRNRSAGGGREVGDRGRVLGRGDGGVQVVVGSRVAAFC